MAAISSRAGSLSTSRHSVFEGSCCFKALIVEPVPQPRSMITGLAPAADTARLISFSSLARLSAGSRNASQSALNGKLDLPFKPCAGYIAFSKGDSKLFDPAVICQLPFMKIGQHAVKNVFAEEFCSGEIAFKLRQFI